MSGGRLVVLDRSGRDAKRYPLASGLATLGSAVACDIRVMLASVCPHHATVAVHNSQTVVRNMGDGETLVNGESVSVAVLQHGDVITLGDRSLRWEYSAPSKRQQPALVLPSLPTLRVTSGRGARGVRRGSAGGVAAPRDRALQLAIEMTHRASMPASSGGKQVAIVQPQRREAVEQTGSGNTPNVPRPAVNPPRSGPQAARRSQPDLDSSVESDADKRKSRVSPKTVPSNTTKATLWIESRKSSPRRKAQAAAQVAQSARRTLSAKKSTPLRLAVLKKAQSAHKLRVVKIEAPLKIDHTKQAAIMLMTGHTPKARVSLNQPKRSPSYPARKTPARKSRQGARGSRQAGDVTPRLGSYSGGRGSKRGSGNQSVSILEVTDSETRAGSVSTRSSKSPLKSPLLLSPKKSALKDLSRKGSRKTESIKFDLSNLEHHQESEITSRFDSEESMSEDEITLRYSESSYQSPSPRKSISSRSGSVLDKLGATLSHSPSRTASTTPGSISSRSGRMLDKLGATLTLSPSRNVSTTPSSPSLRKSARGSMMVQEALGSSVRSELSDLTVASALRTRTLTPTTSNMESYSIVDLVTLDSDTSKSLYNSADSANITDYGTPTVSKRKTRSTINPTILGSSTPYIAHVRATRSRSNPNVSKVSTRSTASTRRSKSLTTPENQNISVNSTRVSRASRSRSRINDSDLLLLDDTELEDSSPKTSRRTRTKSNTIENSQVNSSVNSPEKDGISTPENRHSPVEAGTPVLSIQSLLNSSRSSLTSQNSATRGRKSVNYKRKTIGVLSVPKRRPASKSKSLGASARQTVLRLSKDSSEISDRTDEGAPRPDNEDTVTPKSAVKLVPEAVKNKHSTAKKPQSKRSIIDDLNQSDIVKQLFNSPVKRKLSRSMTEFSRKQLFEDDEIVIAKRPTRNTIALTGRTFDDSVSEHSGTFTPERFVSPISTPSNSPNLSGIKRLFQSNTPKNEPRNARSLLRTHRTRLSAKHDMNTLDGLKLMFTNSPKNRDVRDKKKSPNNDLRRVSGVKVLFRRETSPKNDLTDVRGVKKLFRTSPNNDLRNVSGVKRTMRNSLKNDLSDVRGVRKMFKHGKNKESSHDLSGVEELFNTSSQSTQHSETLFDRWVGKPTVRSVYSKTLSSKRIKNPKNQPRTLHISMDVVPNNVEEWLKQELPKRFQRGEPSASKSRNKSSNANKELQNLVTVTVAGDEPIRASRTRNSSMLKKSASEMYSAHSLPLKKRSLVEVSVEMGKPKLPLKKRAVVHSTPVKGRLHLTMNASELGRVSPIAAFDSPDVDLDASSTRTTRQQKATPEAPEGRASKARTPQATPTKTSPMKSKASPKLSPKITKASPKSSPKKVVRSPPKRVTRNRKNAASETHTKKRRTSLVISKKAPVMSPKGVPNKETSQLIPIKRTTRAKKEQKVVTPKRTRVRAQRATVVVPKPSPKLKPQAKGKGNARTHENITIQVESPKESQPRKTRGKQNEPKGKPNKTDNVPAEKPKRGRRIVAIEFEPPVIVMKRGRGKETSVQEVNQKQPKTRGKKAQIPETVQPEPTTRRGRKNTENVSLQTKPKTGGKKAEPTPLKNEPKMRGKKVEAQSSVQSEPVTRARKTKVIDNTVIPETRGRKRKTVAIEEISPKVAKTETRRGRKAAETLEPVKTTKARTKDTSKTRSTRETTKTGATQDTSKTRSTRDTTKTRATQGTSKSRATQDTSKTKATQDTSKTRSAQGTSKTRSAQGTSKTRSAQGTSKTRATQGTSKTRATQDTSKTRSAQSTSKTRATQGTSKTRATRGNASASNQESKTRGRPKKDAVEQEKATPTKTTRGRKAAEPKETPAADKRKRKTKVEASPAKNKTPSPSPAKRVRRARARAPEESTPVAARGRRR